MPTEPAWCWAALAFTVLLLTGFAAAPAHGAAGDLDPTFSGDGKVTVDLGKWEDGFDVALQPNGKLVVVGDSHDGNASGGSNYVFALARLEPDGSLDSSFSGDGKQTTTFLGLATAQ